MPTFIEGEPVDLLDEDGRRIAARVVKPIVRNNGRGAQVVIRITGPGSTFTRFSEVRAHPSRLTAPALQRR